MNVCLTDYCICGSPCPLGLRSRIFFHLLFVECKVDSKVVFTKDYRVLGKLLLPVCRVIVAGIHPTRRILFLPEILQLFNERPTICLTIAKVYFCCGKYRLVSFYAYTITYDETLAHVYSSSRSRNTTSICTEV